MRALCSALVLLSAPALVKAEDGLPADVLKALKAATVFVKVDAGSLSASGSGFVLKTDKETAYVVTNHHVVRPSQVIVRKVGRTTRETVVTARNASVSVVFDSGTPRERTVRARIVAEDEKKDLAVLEITGSKGLPRPIRSDRPPELRETMPVYVLGFPFGKALATGKGHPAITVGKASVSSLRLNDAGELTIVQIDGAVNPGNSGGPVVDGKGHLVGIAVARIKDSGIGLAIPTRELAAMLKGRVTGFNLQVVQRDKGTMKIKVELGLTDPLGEVRSVTFHYAPGRAKGKVAVSSLPGAKKEKLEIKGQSAVGSITLPIGSGPDVSLTFHTEYVDGDGKALFTAVRSGALKATVGATAERPSPGEAPRGAPLAREALATTLTDLGGSDSFRRLGACERLLKAQPTEDGRKQVLTALTPLLTHPDVFTRCGAIKAHVNWAGKAGLSTYTELLKSDDNFISRGALIRAVARLGGAGAAPALAARLPDLVDRGTASKALKGMGPGAEQAVAGYLNHADWGVRAEACKILKDVGTASSLPALRKASAGLPFASAPAVEKLADEAIAAISARK